MISLMISDVFPPKVGGTGRWYRELYGRLPEVEFVIAAGETPGHEEYDRANPLNLYRLPLAIRNRGIRGFRSLREYLGPLRSLLRIVRSRQISVIHCARCLPEGILALGLRLLTGVPYVCYALGEELNSASLSREQSLWAKIVLSRARMVIACSHNTAKILTSSWNLTEDRVCVLHPGVDTSKFKPATRDPLVRAKLGWSDRPVILTVGRLQERKGHDRMILAMDQIRHAHPDALYAILGDGEGYNFLRRMVEDGALEGSVQFLGELDDSRLVECYQQCDLFVLPNREVNRDIEGFGIVLLEAQACGKPVVAGTSGGTVETMLVGRTGHVVSCDRHEELAALVTSMLMDKDRLVIMGERARRWAVEEFDWSVQTSRAIELFQRIR